MTVERKRFLFLNIGHAYAHLFMLIYPTVVLVLERDLGRDYGDLLLASTAGFVAFGLGAVPAGWLGDRWSRETMLALMFLGLGAGAILTGLSGATWQLAGGLTLIGLAASIYHPVGIAMVAESGPRVGRALGINGVFGNLGVAGAPLLAGGLGEAFGWRWAFVAPGIVALVTAVLFLTLVRARRAATRVDPIAGRVEARGRGRVVVFLVVGGLLGGLTFHATTVAVPKVLDEALGGHGIGPLGAGGLASLIFAAAAFAQIAVGGLIDRHAIRPVAVLVIGLQVPLFLTLVWLTGWAAGAATLAVMILVFGEIPISDALVAHHASAAWRARVYALKYLLSLGVSAATVPLVAFTHAPGEGFGRLFALLALAMALVAGAAAALPAGRAPATLRA